MKYALVLGLAICVLAGCGKKSAEPAATAKPSTEIRDPSAPAIGSFGVDLAEIDNGVDPGDDFYGYVNGSWLKTFKIPDDYESYGPVTMLGERVRARLKTIVENIDRAAPGSTEQKVWDFYQSYLDTATIDANGLQPVAEDLASINAMATTGEIGAALFNPAFRALSPIAISIGIDARRPDRYAVYLGQSGLGMPSRDYYLNDRYADHRRKYREYSAKILRLAGVGDAAAAADRIFALELELARAQWDPAKSRNRDLTYNPKTIGELEEFAPAWPWRRLLASAGMPALGEVILREDDAIQRTAALIAAAPVSTLKEYLTFHLLNANADVLPSAFDAAHFAFHGKEIGGASKRSERWLRALAAAEVAMADSVGKLYVARRFPEDSKAAAAAIAANVRSALGEELGDLDWMSDEVRATALEKLRNLNMKIGYPDRWRDYEALDARAGDAYGNARRAAAFDWAYKVASLGSPVDRAEWAMTPQTVSAYFDPASDEIVFPAAILDAPFFDPKADAAVNYGAIGALMGHELGHGFDEQGRKSNAEGLLVDWWTGDVASRFGERAAMLDAQYASYQLSGEAALNPGLTMAETIGDVGGLALAWRAYKLSLKGAVPPVIDGFTGDQRFFLAFAQALRRAVRDERLRTEIAADPHAPADFRVNTAVRNLAAWYDAFGVTPENDLWLDPEDRVEIW